MSINCFGARASMAADLANVGIPSMRPFHGRQSLLASALCMQWRRTDGNRLSWRRFDVVMS